MKVAGSAVIGVERDRVWAALQDPAVLVRTIPGCERLEESGPDTYRMTVIAGVASVKGLYQGEVALAEPLAPERFVLRARGQGAPGTVDATVLVRLSEIDGGTRVDYDAEAVIGGMIGGVGQRMLGSVAKRTAGEFFAAVEDHLRAPAAPEPAGLALEGAVPAGLARGEAATAPAPCTAPAVQERPGVYERRGAPGGYERQAGTRPWTMLASFGMGAGVTLAGVVVGWLLGRGRGR
ncbi:SRPBCC family protein [Nonomuraea cavernae]|uniref:SRPBCC family protein n=1 Tax=Nonomuraea cavernae TaxID=2045107 RepID=UPI001663F623|nr:carbon monoxide dehydrogenase subunit G [Nonomuraea cavernae]MCA2187020.1 carbon monoxide dehydrogenase subunit G [Nonomuraea cavernae]